MANVRFLITPERLQQILKTGMSPQLIAEDEEISDIEPCYTEGFDGGKLVGFYVTVNKSCECNG